MRDLRTIMLDRRADILPKSKVLAESSVSNVMLVYATTPLSIMFGTYDHVKNETLFEVGAEANLDVSKIEFSMDCAELVAHLTEMPVDDMHVRGHGTESTCYVLKADGPLFTWYKDRIKPPTLVKEGQNV